MARPVRRPPLAASTCLRASTRASRGMGLDYVDIFYSHRFDPDTPLEETMGALDTAVRQGKALYAGISRTRPRRRARLRRSSRARHAAPDPPAVLLDAEPLDRGRPSSTRSATSASAASPSRRSRRGCSPTGTCTASRRARARPRGDLVLAGPLLTEETLAQDPRAERDRGRAGQSLAQLALAWVLRDPTGHVGADRRVAASRSSRTNVAALDKLDVHTPTSSRDRPLRDRQLDQHLGGWSRRGRVAPGSMPPLDGCVTRRIAESSVAPLFTISGIPASLRSSVFARPSSTLPRTTGAADTGSGLDVSDVSASPDRRRRTCPEAPTCRRGSDGRGTARRFHTTPRSVVAER